MFKKLGLMSLVMAAMVFLQASPADAAHVRRSRTVAAAGPVRAGVAHGHVAVRGIGVGKPGVNVVARGTAVGPRRAAHRAVRIR